MNIDPIIILAGKGNMAQAMKKYCEEKGVQVVPFGSNALMPAGDFVVAVHFGSGSELPKLIEHCEAHHIPIIQGSTKLVCPFPTSSETVLVNSPNLSLPMVRLMKRLPDFLRSVGIGMEKEIVESHQKKKPDTSGTARAVAKELGIPEDAIVKIRDVGTQLSLGVPQEHLSGHAYHRFILCGQGVKIGVSTDITGRNTYCEGCFTLALSLLRAKERDRVGTGDLELPKGLYQLKDLLHLLPSK